MYEQFPQPHTHTDADVLKHLAHLRRLHARKTGRALPEEEIAELRRMERPKKPVKAITTIRLSPDVLAAFKATGKGWQTHLDAILREVVAEGRV